MMSTAGQSVVVCSDIYSLVHQSYTHGLRRFPSQKANRRREAMALEKEGLDRLYERVPIYLRIVSKLASSSAPPAAQALNQITGLTESQPNPTAVLSPRNQLDP